MVKNKNDHTMHREQLRNLLNQYHPKYPREQYSRFCMLELLDKCEDCFERSCRPGHFTASSWLVNKTNDKALLMHHKKFNTWLQLGGHCDGDSDLLEVSIKEAKEESGLEKIIPISKAIFDLDVHLLPPNHGEMAHYHYDVRFLLQADSSDFIIPNHESNDMKWFSKEKSGLPTDNPSVLRMFDKWIDLSI